MIQVSKLETGTYFKNAYKLSFPYDPAIIMRVKSLGQRRYLPEDRAWEIPDYELPNLIEKIGIDNIRAEESIIRALNAKEIKGQRAKVRERLKDIKPITDFGFTTKPLPHQVEAFNYGLQRDKMLIGDEQGLGKTKESIDITVARKAELVKTLIVCGVNSVKYNWQKEIATHSHEKSVMIDGKTMDLRVAQIHSWYRGPEFFGIINIESLRKEQIQDALFAGIKAGYIGAVIVDEIHKAKNGNSQQGMALRTLRTPVRIGLSGTPMNKAEDLWNILTWLDVENRDFYKFRAAYCIMGGFNGKHIIGYKNLDSLNGELNSVMLRRRKDEVLDLPPKIYSTEYVELTARQRMAYTAVKENIKQEIEQILATSVSPLSCTLRLRQITSGLLACEFRGDNPKMERVKDMLEEEIIPNGHKAIIFSQWESVIDLYYSALIDYKPIYITGRIPPEDRQKRVEQFQNDPECKIAMGTIGAMGTGLTLNKASYVFFVDKDWNSGNNIQAEDRAHRIGTESTVNVISVVAKDTIDEGIEEYLTNNQAIFDRVVDGKGTKQDIRKILENLLQI